MKGLIKTIFASLRPFLSEAATASTELTGLADGDATPSAPMGVDVLVATAQGRRLFADQRFDRPAPIGGAPVAAGSATGLFLLCEEGREVATLDAASGVRSGTNVVALGGASRALVDRLTIPIAAFDAASFGDPPSASSSRFSVLFPAKASQSARRGSSLPIVAASAGSNRNWS